MIPLKDNIDHKEFPYVNIMLIVINIVVFAYEIGLGPDFVNFLNQYGVVPSKYFATTQISFTRIFPLFSSMFMHAGLLHLAGNMLFLFIFGDNVEDSMGHFRYFFFFILVGLLSNLAHIYTNPASTIPSLGASGAVSGIMGAYILLFPRAQVATLIFLIFFFFVVEIPAWGFLGLWFLLQMINGASSIGASSSSSGVAWFAHIGGFAAGVALVLFFSKRRKEDRLKYF